MVRCSVTQEADENCDALLGMELGKEVWSIYESKIKKTYSLLVCPSWFPAFSVVLRSLLPSLLSVIRLDHTMVRSLLVSSLRPKVRSLHSNLDRSIR